MHFTRTCPHPAFLLLTTRLINLITRKSINSMIKSTKRETSVCCRENTDNFIYTLNKVTKHFLGNIRLFSGSELFS